MIGFLLIFLSVYAIFGIVTYLLMEVCAEDEWGNLEVTAKLCAIFWPMFWTAFVAYEIMMWFIIRFKFKK